MTTLLHLDTSADIGRSNTRRLSSLFVDRWLQHSPKATLLRRDLGKFPPPALNEPFVRAVKTPPNRRSADETAAWAQAEALAKEFLAAERYVIGMPMHILTVPSLFKAYVEQIFHENWMFRMGPNGFEGLLGGRKFLFFLSKGADYRAGAPLHAFDMLEPYLVKLLTFCDVDKNDIKFVSINNALITEQGDADDLLAAHDVVEMAHSW